MRPDCCRALRRPPGVARFARSGLLGTSGFLRGFVRALTRGFCKHIHEDFDEREERKTCACDAWTGSNSAPVADPRSSIGRAPRHAQGPTPTLAALTAFRDAPPRRRTVPRRPQRASNHRPSVLHRLERAQRATPGRKAERAERAQRGVSFRHTCAHYSGKFSDRARIAM